MTSSEGLRFEEEAHLPSEDLPSEEEEILLPFKEYIDLLRQLVADKLKLTPLPERTEYPGLTIVESDEPIIEAPLIGPTMDETGEVIQPKRNPGGLTDEAEQLLCAEVCSRVDGMDATRWAALDVEERLPWLRQALEKRHQPSEQGENNSQVGRKKPGRKSTFEERKKFAKEYWDGLEDGQWESQVDYLKKKHSDRYKKNPKSAQSWLSQLLRRVKENSETE